MRQEEARISVRSPQSAVRIGAIFLVWTLLALLSVAQGAIVFAQRGLPIHWGVMTIRALADWYTCALFTPVFFWLARRFPIDREGWKLGIPVHFVATAICVVMKYSIYVPIARWLEGPRFTLRGMLASLFILETMIFWVVIAIVHAILFYRRWQDRERQARELYASLTEARLEALEGQLRPHFLFNTLNTISSLVHSAPDVADRMVVQLGELLRATLERSGAHEIPLAEELALLERYVGIMQVRFHDRLTIDLRIPLEARRALVPHFILQPLVENALEHGIARRAGAERIEVAATVRAEKLQLSVLDDGPGIGTADGSAPHDEGIGLRNTRLRLQQLYGANHTVWIGSGPNAGTLVSLELPLRFFPEPAPAAGTAGAAHAASTHPAGALA
jgi:two-component sensor histidine kinase